MIEFQSAEIGRAIGSLPGIVHGVEITDTSTLCDLYNRSNYHCRSLFPAEYLYPGPHEAPTAPAIEGDDKPPAPIPQPKIADAFKKLRRLLGFIQYGLTI